MNSKRGYSRCSARIYSRGLSISRHYCCRKQRPQIQPSVPREHRRSYFIARCLHRAVAAHPPATRGIYVTLERESALSLSLSLSLCLVAIPRTEDERVGLFKRHEITTDVPPSDESNSKFQIRGVSRENTIDCWTAIEIQTCLPQRLPSNVSRWDRSSPWTLRLPHDRDLSRRTVRPRALQVIRN